MQIQLLSDLHIESQEYYLTKATGSDLLVLAGDIGVLRVPEKYFRFIRLCSSSYQDVVIVTGNHEYYHNDMVSVHKAINDFIEDEGLTNVHFLNNESKVIQGKLFFGATFWSDHVNPAARRMINDFRVIDLDEDTAFTYKMAQDLHTKSIRELQSLRVENPDSEIIVVSHHAPSYKSVSDRFIGDELNSGFVSDLEWLIKEVKPLVWFHGHVHSQHNYDVHGTSVVCNARGYRGEDVGPFNDICTVTV